MQRKVKVSNTGDLCISKRQHLMRRIEVSGGRLGAHSKGNVIRKPQEVNKRISSQLLEKVNFSGLN